MAVEKERTSKELAHQSPRRSGMVLIEYTSQDDWSVEQLQKYLHQVNILYNRLYVLDQLVVGANMPVPQMLSSSLSLVPEAHRLTVRYIEFKSPGGFSFEGLGDVIKEFRGLWRDVTYDNRLDRQSKRSELDDRKQFNQIKLQLAETKLIEAKIDLLKKVGATQEEIKKSVDQLINPMSKIIEMELKQDILLVDDKNDDSDNA